MDGFNVFIAVCVLLLAVLVSFSAGRNAVASDCKNYGRSKVERVMVECRTVPAVD